MPQNICIRVFQYWKRESKPELKSPCFYLAVELCQLLKVDFLYHVRKKDQINIETKIKVCSVCFLLFTTQYLLILAMVPCILGGAD